VAGLALFAPYLGNRAVSAVYNGDGKLFGSIAATITEDVLRSANPAITSIKDVPDDQGRQVRLRFRASGFDFVGSGTPILRYEIFRQVAPGLAPARAEDASLPLASHGATGPATIALDGWDLVGTTTAQADSAYLLVVPTLADSNSGGLGYATFLVRAETATPGVYYDSAADSGYSVDNMPPGPPAPFTAAYAGGATHLHWGPNVEPDLWYYRVYRGSSAGFVPGPSNLIATPSDTGFVDPGAAGNWYKLAAVDVNGNESGFAVLGPGGTVDVADNSPLEFALHAVRPNPAVGSRLSVGFVLQSAAPAWLELLDVSGRQVAKREVGTFGPGRHQVDLTAGRQVAPGLYLVRLVQGGNVRVTRAVVLR
jgi:hypothetical protein